ncbi:glycosyltransferase [Parasphingopyxis marina]|uniref:Glycosyltransferase n=1 Tax=Parasphingopyxis marina TaxID=2761622 RepID=A0A842HXF2_9SPHN|nr:glycosyltransferase [Parasphingopyxis marina]MBC2778818.1 glycosyltransferase [Parasphingopyxis marina]
MLRVLTLSTLFPDATRPTFGNFVERQTMGLAARDDVQLEVVAPIGIPPWPLSRHARYRPFAAIPEQEIWKDIIVHRPRFSLVPRIGGRFSPARMAKALLPVLRTIRERFPFDVIDAEFFYPDGPAAMRLAEALGVPFSVKARGGDIHHWAAQAGCRPQIIAAAEEAGGVLAVSEALKADMAALGMAEEKIAVHYTGIDRTRFAPVDRTAAKAALGLSGPLIVTVGALMERKGQRLALEALPHIPGARLILAGEGPDRAILERRALKLGLADRVDIPGVLPHDRVAALVAAADVMVLPSVSEGLANAWVEALASGTPIVISDAGGAREVVDRREAGAIVARDPGAIADAVNALLADPPAQAAVAATVDRFSWERNSEQLFAHLSRLAERH